MLGHGVCGGDPAANLNFPLSYFISKLCNPLENWLKLPQAQSCHHSCLGIIKTQGMLQGEDKEQEKGGVEP